MFKNRINFLQNVLIILLSVSALLLFIYQQLDPQTSSYFASLLPSMQTESDASDKSPESLTSLQAVARAAVSGTYGRYGDLHLTNTSDDFAGIRNLLQEALGSAGTLTSCSERDLRKALNGSSVYCDWTVPLPLSVAAGLVGASTPDMEFNVRRMVLSASEDAVTLFLTDDETFLCCTTKVSADSLLEFISSVQMSSVAFAYELGETATDPYTLLNTGDLPDYPLLSSASATQPTDRLLSALGFNPNTNSRYTESSGTEVVRDGERTLRIETDSTLLYDSSGGDVIPELSITTSGTSVTAAEAVLGSYRVLSRLIADSDASLCLQGVRPTEHGWSVTFDYQINGVLLRLSSGEPAAQAEVSSTGVTSFTMRLRRYSAAEDSSSLLLPLRQALAIAASDSDGELGICYVDSGSMASAAWLEE